MRIGLKLKMLRRQRRLILAAVPLASTSHLSDVERGRTLPSLTLCQQLADFYGVTLSELFRNVAIDERWLRDAPSAPNVWEGDPTFNDRETLVNPSSAPSNPLPLHLPGWEP